MWRRYFKLKVIPGVIIHQRLGKIDFRRDDLPVSLLQELWENDFPYVEITGEGKRELYGIQVPDVPLVIEEKPFPDFLDDLSPIDEDILPQKSRKRRR